MSELDKEKFERIIGFLGLFFIVLLIGTIFGLVEAFMYLLAEKYLLLGAILLFLFNSLLALPIVLYIINIREKVK